MADDTRTIALGLLKAMLPGLYQAVQNNETGARKDLRDTLRDIRKIEESLVERPLDFPALSQAGAFPASPATPGQQASIKAFERFRRGDAVLEAVWWDDYRALRGEGWDWRKAVFIAWSASPAKDRWPATQDELATQCLGLTTDRSIRNWKAKYPEMEERIVKLQAEPFMRYRRDVIEALATVASMSDPRCAADRKLFLTITRDYRNSADLNVSMTPISYIEVADPEEDADDGA